MDFNNKVVVITGGAQGIGRCTAEEFQKQGAIVAIIDLQDRPDDCVANLYYKGDVGVKADLDDFTANSSAALKRDTAAVYGMSASAQEP